MKKNDIHKLIAEELIRESKLVCRTYMQYDGRELFSLGSFSHKITLSENADFFVALGILHLVQKKKLSLNDKLCDICKNSLHNTSVLSLLKSESGLQVQKADDIICKTNDIIPDKRIKSHETDYALLVSVIMTITGKSAFLYLYDEIFADTIINRTVRRDNVSFTCDEIYTILSLFYEGKIINKKYISLMQKTDGDRMGICMSVKHGIALIELDGSHHVSFAFSYDIPFCIMYAARKSNKEFVQLMCRNMIQLNCIPKKPHLVKLTENNISDAVNIKGAEFIPMYMCDIPHALSYAYACNYKTFLLKDGSFYAGIVICKIVDKAAEILYILTDSDVRNKGYGKIMLAMLSDKFVQSGADRVWLSVMRDNTNAVNFYERNCFKKLFDREDYSVYEKMLL